MIISMAGYIGDHDHDHDVCNDFNNDLDDDCEYFNDDHGDFPWQATCCCTWPASVPSLFALPPSPLPGYFNQDYCGFDYFNDFDD